MTRTGLDQSRTHATDATKTGERVVTGFVAVAQRAGSIGVLSSSCVGGPQREEATEPTDPGYGGRDGSGR